MLQCTYILIKFGNLDKLIVLSNDSKLSVQTYLINN